MTSNATDNPLAETGFALFETAIGTCGVVWTARGIKSIQLPEYDADGTRARITRRFPEAKPAEMPMDVLLAIGRIVALLRGQHVDLRPILLDMDAVPQFDRTVYAAAREIPAGETVTYGAIAKQLGQPDAAREVGAALGRNPFAIVVPCHRVVAANGKTGGFSARGGVETKLKLLSIEGGHGPLFSWGAVAEP